MKGSARSFAPHATTRAARTVTLFVSYSHQNKVWMQRLNPLLVGLQYDDRARDLVGLHRVSAWHDHELKAGDRWDADIKSALDEMDIFVPLVSAQFFASWYVMNVELPKAEERHGAERIAIVPILLEDVNLRKKCSFLDQFTPLPAHGRWWSSFRSFADAHRPIDDGLWEVIEKALKRK